MRVNKPGYATLYFFLRDTKIDPKGEKGREVESCKCLYGCRQNKNQKIKNKINEKVQGAEIVRADNPLSKRKENFFCCKNPSLSCLVT